MQLSCAGLGAASEEHPDDRPFAPSAAQAVPLRAATLIALLAIPLGACSQLVSAPAPALGVGAKPSEIATSSGPKGGGIYKVGNPYKVAGRWYVPHEVEHYERSGTASWYGGGFHGRRTANGEIYDMNALTAGHPTLPLPSYAYVTNLDNGRTILVRINDRGPYVKDRMIDLSRRSATELGFSGHGLAHVRLRYAGRAPLDGNDVAERRHLAAQSWYEGDLKVASHPGTAISTGAVAVSESAPAWSVTSYRRQLDGDARDGAASGRTSLGGPDSQSVSVGPFSTRAEAERMRHELAHLGPASVEQAGTPAEPHFQVVVGPLGNAAEDAAAQMARFPSLARAAAAVEGGK